MEGGVIDLSRYRLDKAMDELDTAKALFELRKFNGSVDRSYYAIFHALRSVTVLDHFDSSKHSGIISYFNRHHVKSGLFAKETSALIDQAFKLRHKADYQDLYVVSEEQARTQIEAAMTIIDRIRSYLMERWSRNPKSII